MTSNVFILPRSVDTLNAGRIKTNKSASAVLQHFYDTNQPTSSSITIENQTGLLDGMLWSKKYSENIPTNLQAYNNTNFIRAGISKTDVNTFAHAQSLVFNNVLQAGELVRCYEDDALYIVSDNNTSLVSVGVGTQQVQQALNTLHLNGNAYSKFFKIDYPTTATGNITLPSLSVGTANILVSGTDSTISVGNKVTTFSGSPSSYLFMTVNGVMSSNSYVETRSSSTSVLDISKASKFTINASSDVTISFANTASVSDISIISIIYYNTDYCYINWPTNVKWPNGTEPFPPIAGNVGTYTLISADGGSIWYGMLTSNTYI